MTRRNTTDSEGIYRGVLLREKPDSLLPICGTISRQITKNIAHREEYIQTELFPEDKVKEMRNREGEGYVDEKHRPIELTTFQKKLILWLSDYISRQSESKDIQNKISALNTWVEYEPKYLLLQALQKELLSLPSKDMTEEEKRKRREEIEEKARETQIGLPNRKELQDTFAIANNDIKRFVSYIWLSQKMFSGSTRERHMTEIRKGVEELAQVYCPIVYDGKIGMYEPLISLSSMTAPVMVEEIESSSERRGRKREKEVSLGRWINFSSSFFYKANTEFAIITPKLSEILQKNGNEVFLTLLFDLCAKTYQYRGRAKKAKAQAEAEVKRKAYNGKTEEERSEYIRSKIDEALTYSVFDDTLKEKMRGDYSSARQYKARYEKLLSEAVEALKDYGIIKSGKRSQSKFGVKGYKRYFVFNYDFGKQEYEETQEMGEAELSLLPEE